MSDVKISVVVATLNAVDTLENCITSFIEQNYANKELIIIDGGSTDGTIRVLKKYSDQIQHWESGYDDGVYSAWNKAIPRTSGDWIYFLGADDTFFGENALSSIATCIQQKASTDVRIIYGSVNVVSVSGNLLETRGSQWSEIKENFRHKKMAIPHQGCFHHCSLFDMHGLFDESFKIAGDFEFLLRELSFNDALFCEHTIVANMRIGGLSSTVDGELTTFSETRKALKMHGRLMFSLSVFAKLFCYKVIKVILNLFGETYTKRLLHITMCFLGRHSRWSRSE